MLGPEQWTDDDSIYDLDEANPHARCDDPGEACDECKEGDE